MNISVKNVNGLYYFYKDDKKISPWNDINLKENNLYNFICEIPKWTRDKFEINKTIQFNPIIQDVINNKKRTYEYGDIFFNYGAFPQTWEDPMKICDYTKLCGDDDPLDVIEIGLQQIKIGEIQQVKIIGIIPYIDNNETDWKVIAISKNDIMFEKINSIEDLEMFIPNLLDCIITWLLNYKKKQNINNYIMNNQCLNTEFAEKIINNMHSAWKTKHILN